jgi:hypothetical protein
MHIVKLHRDKEVLKRGSTQHLEYGDTAGVVSPRQSTRLCLALFDAESAYHYPP